MGGAASRSITVTQSQQRPRRALGHCARASPPTISTAPARPGSRRESLGALRGVHQRLRPRTRSADRRLAERKPRLPRHRPFGASRNDAGAETDGLTAHLACTGNSPIPTSRRNACSTASRGSPSRLRDRRQQGARRLVAAERHVAQRHAHQRLRCRARLPVLASFAAISPSMAWAFLYCSSITFGSALGYQSVQPMKLRCAFDWRA